MLKKLGCLAFVAIAVWFSLEAWVGLLAGRWLSHHFEPVVGSGGVLLVLLWTVIAIVIGVKYARYHVAQIVPGVLKGTAGGHVIGLIGAVLLALPGLMSDIPGILLLLPPVQRLFTKLGSSIVAAVVKRSMGKMFGGGFPGGAFPGGGFPGGGFPGGPFPGMKPLTPDDRASVFGSNGRKAPKTIDVDVEK